MAEHRIVVPGVVGSSPISHPRFFSRISLRGCPAFSLELLFIDYGNVIRAFHRNKHRK
jgi:hypothetical protein